MTRLACACAAAILVHAVALPRAQSVYPTGTTIYDRIARGTGSIVLSPLATQAVVVIDMNGNVVISARLPWWSRIPMLSSVPRSLRSPARDDEHRAGGV